MITCAKKKKRRIRSQFFFYNFSSSKIWQLLLANTARALRRIAFSRRSDCGEWVKFLACALLSERLEQAMQRKGPCFVVTSSKEIDFILATSLLPPPQALGFSRGGERETRVTLEWLVTKRKGPWGGERREAPAFSFPPSFARKFWSVEIDVDVWVRGRSLEVWALFYKEYCRSPKRYQVHKIPFWGDLHFKRRRKWWS